MPLDKDKILRELKHLKHLKIEIFDEIDSTNTYLMGKAQSGEKGWTIALAEKQTAGRGRLGRRWESPPGVGLWFSLLFHPPFPESQLSLFTLFLGVLVLETLEKVVVSTDYALHWGLKWPNDIFLNGKKLGGILVQGNYQGNRLMALVVGVGLNINHHKKDFPPHLQETATSLLLETQKTWERENLFIALVKAFVELIPRFPVYPVDKLIHNYRDRLLFYGGFVTVETTDKKRLKGTLLGINEQGHLLLKTENGIVEIGSGDIFPIGQKKIVRNS